MRSTTPHLFLPSELVQTGRGIASLATARRSCQVLPHGYERNSPPLRAANSHSSSVGKRYVTPSRFDLQLANASASFWETLTTGHCSCPGSGWPRTQWLGTSWLVLRTNSAYSALVTSVRSIKNFWTVTGCTGCS